MTRLQLVRLALAVAVFLVAVASVLPGWVWHPLGDCTGTAAAVTRCRSYNFWSGISGSFIVSLPNWLIAGALLWRHHNCHHKGCWAPGHRHPKHGWPSCKAHWKETPDHVEGP